jgi:preprotein translocase subunit SecA
LWYAWCMIRNIIEKIFGTESGTFLKSVEPLVQQINALESHYEGLSNEEVQEHSRTLRARVGEGASLETLLPEAFALVREASKRTLKQRHYDVQLIGGIALHRGIVAEMRTGEGKTLVGTLPVYLNALMGRGVHVITVNDFLARRDAQWMGQIYHFLGMSVGILNEQGKAYRYDESHMTPTEDEVRDREGGFRVDYDFLKPCSRSDAYACDITYGTNNQFGFDYLYDNTQYDINRIVQRDHYFALIDEVDSVLIDEARVPLILSAPGNTPPDIYKQFARLARMMERDTHYAVDEKLKAISLTEAGIEYAEKQLQIPNLYTNEHIGMVHHLETALRAEALFRKDTEYVVRANEVMIIDQFTGRMQEGRRFSDGLHQALEAKENVPIQKESKTLASITYQNYFKFYEKLSGMTGTGKTSEEEFQKVYNLSVIAIPTHRPIARIDHSDLIFQTEQGKFKAIARKVKEINKKGQPVLIGTISIDMNEKLSRYLSEAGVPHTLLNAKNHEAEGTIVAEAGKKGAVTIATNMAGRGVDIKLGGALATPEEQEEIKSLGGLYVIGTERHEARRIDNQLRGRAGRQGDPGETQFYVSLEDSLVRVFGGDRVKGMIGALGIPEDEPITHSFISSSLEKAQKKIEGFHFDSRKNILAFDDVLAKHRNTVYTKRRGILFFDTPMIQALLDEIKNLSSENERILQEKETVLGTEVFLKTIQRTFLALLDRLWMQHLEVMDYARQSVNLRAYGQREPITEYRREGARLFKEMDQAFVREAGDILMHLNTDALLKKPATVSPTVTQAPPIYRSDGSKYERNDKVAITKNGETQEIKYKKLDAYLSDGWTIVT